MAVPDVAANRPASPHAPPGPEKGAEAQGRAGQGMGWAPGRDGDKGRKEVRMLSVIAWVSII